MDFRLDSPVQLRASLFSLAKLEEGFSQVQVIGDVVRGYLGSSAQQV